MNHYNFIIINSSLVLLLLYRFLTGNFGKPLSLFFLVIVTVIIITLTPSSVSDEARRSLMGRVKVGFGTLSDHPVVTRLGLKRSLPQDHVRRGSQWMMNLRPQYSLVFIMYSPVTAAAVRRGRLWRHTSHGLMCLSSIFFYLNSSCGYWGRKECGRGGRRTF